MPADPDLDPDPAAAASAPDVPMPPALFVPEGAGVVVPTELCRGPWDHGALHGGPLGGLAGWAVERVAPAGMQLIRLTVELWAAVRLEPVEVVATAARPGKRVAVIDAEARQQGRVVMRASSQWATPGEIRPGGTGSVGPRHPAELPPRPSQPYDPAAGAFDYPRPGFNADAVELRPVSGNTEEPGPGVVWLRVRQPVVAGSPLTPLQQIACTADLGAAVGWEEQMINTDVTLHLSRYPRGPWLLFASRAELSDDGLGLMDTVVSDDAGLFGRILQSQVESPYRLRLDA
jgi:hypothetical protein